MAWVEGKRLFDASVFLAPKIISGRSFKATSQELKMNLLIILTMINYRSSDHFIGHHFFKICIIQAQKCFQDLANSNYLTTFLLAMLGLQNLICKSYCASKIMVLSPTLAGSLREDHRP